MNGRALRIVAPAAGTAAVVWWALPRIAGAPWHTIAGSWRGLSAWDIFVLGLLWIAGLLAHCNVLMGALPGLSRRRAMTLNLTGSAVSNVVPLGGGLGIGLNYLMVRRWGFSAGEFSVLTVVSNAWNLLAKALLPGLAVGLLLVVDEHVDGQILGWGLGASGLIVCAAGVTVAVVCTDGGSRLVARGTRLTGRLSRRPRSSSAGPLVNLRRGSAAVVRKNWRPMTLGMVLYYALGCALLWTSLHVVGSSLGIDAVVVLFALERALTAVPITPGGSGVVELGTTALAIALSGPQDTAVVAAGILLYRAVTFGLEIPVGAVWLVCWLAVQRFRTPSPQPSAMLRAAEVA